MHLQTSVERLTLPLFALPSPGRTHDLAFPFGLGGCRHIARITSGRRDVAPGVAERGQRSVKPMPFADFMESIFGGNSDAIAGRTGTALSPAHAGPSSRGRGSSRLAKPPQEPFLGDYSRAARPPQEPQPGSVRSLDAEDAANAKEDEQARHEYLQRLDREKQTAEIEHELAALHTLIDTMPEDINRCVVVRYIDAGHGTETCILSDTKHRSRKRKGRSYFYAVLSTAKPPVWALLAHGLARRMPSLMRCILIVDCSDRVDTYLLYPCQLNSVMLCTMLEPFGFR